MVQSFRLIAAIGLLLSIVFGSSVLAGGADPPLAFTTSMNTVTLEIKSQTSGQVVFQISNQGTVGIFYGLGCKPPEVEMRFDTNWITLAQRIVESVPEAKYLAPGKKLTCKWNFSAWQDPTQKGLARFQNYVDQLPVPPGHYRLALTYYTSEQHLSENNNPKRIYSESFAVKD